MKNLIQKINKKNITIFLSTILVFSVIFTFYNQHVTIVEAKEQLLNTSTQLNDVKKFDSRDIKKQYNNLIKEAEKLAIQEEELRIEAGEILEKAAQVKRSREETIWESRCVEKNNSLFIKGESPEDCTTQLERFASYNLGN